MLRRVVEVWIMDYGPRRRLTWEQAFAFARRLGEKLCELSPADWLTRPILLDYERECEVVAIPLDGAGFWVTRFKGGSPTPEVIEHWVSEHAHGIAKEIADPHGLGG